jgi:hypothetical protein
MVMRAQQANPERSRVLTSVVQEVAKRVDLGSTDLKDIIGVSQSTASRLLNGNYEIPEGSKPWELSAMLVRMYRSLSSMVGGDDELARTWMHSPNRAFGGRNPAEEIKRVEGLVRACEYLDAYRARI